MNAKDNSKRSFDRQAATYDTDKNGAHARRLYPFILSKIGEFPGTDLLDVGCGTGEMLRLLSEHNPQMKLTGIDISERMLEKAGFKVGEKARLIPCDAEKMPFDDNSFDTVMCNDSFHHYPAPLNVLREFYRILKPGGVLLISDYRIGFPLRQIMNLFIKYGYDGDVRIYSEKELINMLCACSFKNISYEKIDVTGCMITAQK